MKICRNILIFSIVLFVFTGCQKPEKHRLEADEAALKIIAQHNMTLFGMNRPMSIERPSDILRRRLFEGQGLPYVGPESLGTDRLEKIEHWPEENYPRAQDQLIDPVVMLEEGMPVKMTLIEALQIGAQNSFDYQSMKESIFEAALDLDLEEDAFRPILSGVFNSNVVKDKQLETTRSTSSTTGDFGISQQFENGASITSAIAIDTAKLLADRGNATGNVGDSTFGSVGDLSIRIPLLRGSGRHIVTEPLTQAQRNVVYAMYEFERFKKTFAVNVASDYLGVLSQLDEVKNNEDNYRRLIASAIRARRRADAGRLTEVEVDQAVQDELRARNNWIRAKESYKSRLDSFKNLLNLPTDAQIELDRSELAGLSSRVEGFLARMEEQSLSQNDVFSVESEIVLAEPDMENRGSLEIDEEKAIQLAFENRLDLRVTVGRVYDSQRAIVVRADDLRGELTIEGGAQLGLSRSGSPTSKNTKARVDVGVFSVGMTLDLPLERTQERNNYRKAYIDLERAVRNVQEQEDRIKLDIRNNLRALLEARESLLIQTKSVKLAEKRVRSVNMFLEAGRAAIRDLLEAQDSLLQAQNSLTSAMVSYRVAELELQRDMGVLQINEKGLWTEYSPEVAKNE
ncbi:MAG: TolC family protein [Sedimentisphaerales bacterium]|nr:TolC family protein [Sedimentisphaerales bacterium]